MFYLQLYMLVIFNLCSLLHIQWQVFDWFQFQCDRRTYVKISWSWMWDHWRLSVCHRQRLMSACVSAPQNVPNMNCMYVTTLYVFNHFMALWQNEHFSFGQKLKTILLRYQGSLFGRSCVRPMCMCIIVTIQRLTFGRSCVRPMCMCSYVLLASCHHTTNTRFSSHTWNAVW